MPWPATHILIAEKIFDGTFHHLDRDVFLVGTSFPDIRYPARVARDRTHLELKSLSEMGAQSSFEAGLSFHSFVDHLWNQTIRANHAQLFSELPHERAMIHAMKVLQDRFLYDRSDRWGHISRMFQTILPEEHTFGIGQDMLQRWHTLLSHYLSKPPERSDLEMLKFSLAGELVEKISRYYQTYGENQTLYRVSVRFYEDFDSLI